MRFDHKRSSVAQPTAKPQTHTETGGSSKDFEDFIYLISHDVRNSVRALLELPQWITEDLAEAGVPISGSVEDSISLMNRHTCRLDRMLVDLLTFSRVGRMQDTREVDLQKALDHVLEEIHVPSGYQIVRALDCTTLSIGDRDILTLLTALITNAIKHHDRDSGKIIVATYQDRGDLVLSVQDNGPGIPEGAHEKVFGAMTTLRPRDEVEGSGMGLALTRKIAQHYRGRARISSTDGTRGTRIEVRLPRSRPN
ncbi:sensor histidine kinase [Sulfitobacter sabulilitoris]|uniref:histidine kinase n=1 Tax=Sulfitobacter sabulilitoris TaxID=2562655 RepID=A0A5S3PME9_9RHOB|nr:HAMP domain-containing sensor histidine kinase [Sulfitobacter sabulilitoris]TMM55456.1 HAMP domain-containing histidine kinase [Sulfitobacter sabulilitoris]